MDGFGKDLGGFGEDFPMIFCIFFGNVGFVKYCIFLWKTNYFSYVELLNTSPKTTKSRLKINANLESENKQPKIVQNQFWEHLGLHLGRVWGGLGPLLGTLGRLLAIWGAFKIELFSNIGPRWAPRDLLDRFREGFGKDLEGFGEDLGSIWDLKIKTFGPLLHVLGC